MPEPSNCQPGKPFPENPSYILEERVDDGSSTVWRAKKKPNGDQTESGARRYAIKIYESKQDYENEFNALSLLFPSQGKTTELIGIVRPVAWCNEDAKKRKLFYVVEQYYPQRFDDIFVSLAHVASNLGHVRVDELSKRLLFHLAAALNVIHSRQITHNDIRKENVLCDGEQFYLIDFGSAISLSKQKRSSSKLTMRKDITDLGALLFQVWVYPRQEFNHGNVNSAKLPSWLHRLLSEMLDEKKIKDGRDLWNSLSRTISDDPEWLLNDREWLTLSEYYDRAVMVQGRDRHYRLGRGALITFAASSNGDYLAVATAIGWWIKRLSDNLTMHFEQASNIPMGLAWNRSDDLAICYGDHRVEIWQCTTKSGKPEFERRSLLPRHPERLISLAWKEHKGNRLLALGGEQGVIYVWDVTRDPPNRVGPLYRHGGGVAALAFSPSTAAVLASGGGNDRKIRLWSINDATGQIQFDLASEIPESSSRKRNRMECGEVTGLAWFDDTTLISTAKDHAIRLWQITPETATNKVIVTLQRKVAGAHSGAIDDLAIDGDIVFTAGRDGVVRGWKGFRSSGGQNTTSATDDPRPVLLAQHSTTHPTQLAVVRPEQKDYRILLTGSQDHRGIHQYRYAPKGWPHIEYMRTLRIFDSPVTALEWLNDVNSQGRYDLLIGTSRGDLEHWRVAIGLLPVVDRQEAVANWPLGVQVTDQGTVRAGFGAIVNLARKPFPTGDGGMAVAFTSRTLHLFDSVTQQFKAVNTHNAAVHGPIAWHPQKSLLAFAADRGRIGLWTPGHDSIVVPGDGGRVRQLAFSPDGNWLAVAGNTLTLRVFPVCEPPADSSPLGSPLCLPACLGSLLTGLAWSSDSSKLALTDERASLYISDLQGGLCGSLPTSLTQKAYRIMGIADSSCELKLIAVYEDHSLQAWRFTSHVSGDTSNWKSAPLIQNIHTDHITDLKLSPDGKWLASGSLDGSVVILAMNELWP